MVVELSYIVGDFRGSLKDSFEEIANSICAAEVWIEPKPAKQRAQIPLLVKRNDVPSVAVLFGIDEVRFFLRESSFHFVQTSSDTVRYCQFGNGISGLEEKLVQSLEAEQRESQQTTCDTKTEDVLLQQNWERYGFSEARAEGNSRSILKYCVGDSVVFWRLKL